MIDSDAAKKPFDVETIRFRGEDTFSKALIATGIFSSREGAALDRPDVERTRRYLLTTHVKLTENMAPEVYACSNAAANALNLGAPVEIYQASGEENAANWMCSEIAFISLRGQLISLLDHDSFVALFGHEFGHHMAHTGPFEGQYVQDALDFANRLAADYRVPETVRSLASRLSMAKEFTADRFGAIAASSLDGPLRLMMTLVTGLPSERLVSDAAAYLEQARALFGDPQKAETETVGSHPEHLLRAFALGLFAETDVFKDITGQGSGLKTLAEVDAILETILNGNQKVIIESQGDSVLSPEVQEFALCAAVLVAAADEHIDESETKALEDTFSNVVPDWKELLDLDLALERYSELLPVALAGGEPTAIGVFNVLLHVMLADREVHPRELKLIEAVGRSLEQGPLFEYLLQAMGDSLRVSQREEPVEAPMPSLPPGRREATAALAGLFAGLSRRGGGKIAVRRLLRIVGRTAWDAELGTMVNKELQRVGLEIEATPATETGNSVNTDQTLTFRLTEAEREKREESRRAKEARGIAEAKTKDALTVALKHLRERLVSGDGRSPSVRLYKAMVGRHFDLTQLDRVIEARSERIVALLREEDAIPLLTGEEIAAHKTAGELFWDLRALDREFKARVEETGSRDLFLGYPFVIGLVDGFFFRAPLILHPFSLVTDSRGAGTYSLKRREGDEPSANQALLRVLFAKKNFAFTDTLAEELDAKAAESTEALLDALHQLGMETRPMSGAVASFATMNPVMAAMLTESVTLAENAVIGFFPQSSSDLLQDYNDLLACLDPSSPTELDKALNAACDILPVTYRPEFIPSAIADGVDEPIIYADPSQRDAVRRSRKARLLVMDGPPGTGKSQTIVNLVADALSRGEHVAVVCEKRVALDVVKQRMDGAGIGHLAAVVHDVSNDRKAVYQHIADRLESVDRKRGKDTRLTTLRTQAEELERQLAVRDELLATPTDAEMSVGQLHVVASSTALPPATAAGMLTVNRENVRRLSSYAREIHPFARFWRSGSPFRGGPTDPERRSLAASSSAQCQAVHEDLLRARDAMNRYEALAAKRPLSPSALEAAEASLRFAIPLGNAMKDLEVADAFGTMLAVQIRDQDKVVLFDDSIEQIEKYREEAVAEATRINLEEPPDLDATLADAKKKAGSFFRFLSSSWRKAKRTIRELVASQWPEQAKTKIKPPFLEALTRRVHAARAWHAAENLFRALRMQAMLPRDAESLLRRVEEFKPHWADSRILALAKTSLSAIGLWPLAEGATQPNDGWNAWVVSLNDAVELLDAQREKDKAMGKVVEVFPHAASFDSSKLGVLADTFSNEAYALCDADRVLVRMREVLPEAGRLVENLADQDALKSGADWIDAVHRGWAETHLVEAERRVFGLRALDQPPPFGDLEAASSRLLELHEDIAKEVSKRITVNGDTTGLMSIHPAEPRARRTKEQAAREEIIRECRKQRRVMPLRTLVRRYAKDGLLDVVPVWLMSPETTAILFPREPIFDLLIIDEASQCTVENGFPVLTRAARAVIAGDEKQMPPTAFFKATAGFDDESEEEVESDVPSDVFEAESLLNLSRHIGTGAPLRWHYRSLYEELIAFSNHSMYGGSLLTIPAPLSRSAAAAMRWIPVPDGRWVDGANEPEAKIVVGLIADLLKRKVCPTIGVVTFNIQQRKTVLDAIDARRNTDPEFAKRYDEAAASEAMDARPFVKNLESVQGDERDVIIFSLGYSPVQRKKKDGSGEIYVPARFGPLGQKGGERRLNVAVSRAKTEIVVVSSFEPNMLSVAHTKNDGPRLFKSFVEFAFHMGQGRRNQAEKILAFVNDLSQRGPGSRVSPGVSDGLLLPMYHQIALELEKAGLDVEKDVGSSEFRLPIAVVHPNDRNRYALAILCEDGYEVGSVYERYVHIPNVLARRGWQYIRVNSREWHRDRKKTLDRIVQTATRALAEAS